jgi:hypothetical protein
MQHGYYIIMYGPEDMDNGQIESIKDSCLVSVVAMMAPYLPEIAAADTT